VAVADASTVGDRTIEGRVEAGRSETLGGGVGLLLEQALKTRKDINRTGKILNLILNARIPAGIATPWTAMVIIMDTTILPGQRVERHPM
jgi:hypothetical protein